MQRRRKRPIKNIRSCPMRRHRAILGQRDGEGAKTIDKAVEPVNLARRPDHERAVQPKVRNRIRETEFPIEKMRLDDFKAVCDPIDRGEELVVVTCVSWRLAEVEHDPRRWQRMIVTQSSPRPRRKSA